MCAHQYNKSAYKKRGDEMNSRTGRPKSDNPMNERLYIRVTKEEKEEINHFSKENGYTLLELIRMGIKKAKEIKK